MLFLKLIGLLVVLWALPAKADVTYKWVTTSVTNLDPAYCGTAECAAGLISLLDLLGGIPPGPAGEIVFSDAIVASGSVAAMFPPASIGSPRCPTCADLGILLLPYVGEGSTTVDLSFADAPLLSGSISATGYTFGFYLAGAGLNWSGVINGDDPIIGESCRGSGCDVTGYWVDPPAAAEITIPEPPAIASVIQGLLALCLVLRGRKRSAATGRFCT